MPKKRASDSNKNTEEADAPLEVVKSVLERAGIGTEPLKNAEGLRVAIRDNGEPTAGYAHLVQSVFMFRLVIPKKVPKAHLPAVTEFVTRANNGLIVGNFELDLDTGEVKFKTYVDYRGAKLGRVAVRSAVLGAMEIYEGYAPALSAVLQGKMTVKAAIKSVEG